MRRITGQTFIGRLEIYEWSDGSLSISEDSNQEVTVLPGEVDLFLEWAHQKREELANRTHDEIIYDAIKAGIIVKDDNVPD